MATSTFLSKWNFRFRDNDQFLIDEQDLREFAGDIDERFKKIGTGTAITAKYWAPASINGKSAFVLSPDAVAIQAQLRLLRSGAATPAYPAPALAADRPALAAPGSPFVLPSTVGPASSKVAIAAFTKQVADGGRMLLSGLGLGNATYPYYRNGQFLETSVVTATDSLATVQLPAHGLTWDFGLAWAAAADGVSVPIALNRATLTFAQTLAAEGLTISVCGRNLAHGNIWGGASYLAVEPLAGGEGRVLTGAAPNPYRAEFTITGLPAGRYRAWPHNGHGQDYGWGESFVLEVVDRQAHVLTRSWGAVTDVALSPSDAADNSAALNDAYTTIRNNGGGVLRTPAGRYPIDSHVYLADNVKWICDTGVTTLIATDWQSSYLGMFATNQGQMNWVENIEFLNPDDLNLPYSDALIILKNPTHLCLRGVKARWSSDVADQSKTVQPLRVEHGHHVFLDDLVMTGTGSYVHENEQLFVRNYTHFATNSADHCLYSERNQGWALLGATFRDLDPNSTNGVTKGSGRGLKRGNHKGYSEYCHRENIVGMLMGPDLAAAQNKYPNDNQGEGDLEEANETVLLTSATAATTTTITLASIDGLDITKHLLYINGGRGADQMRRITSLAGKVATLDKPLLVTPDTNSQIALGTFTRGNTAVNISWSGKPQNTTDTYNAQCVISLYGGSTDTVIDTVKGTDNRALLCLVGTQERDNTQNTISMVEIYNVQGVRNRWDIRFDAYGSSEHPDWHSPASGIRNVLIDNYTSTGNRKARLVMALPRTQEDRNRWAAVPIANVSLGPLAQPLGYINDYRVIFGQQPADVLDSCLSGFSQVPAAPLTSPTLARAGAASVLAVEALPAGATINSDRVLTFPTPAYAPWLLGYLSASGFVPLALVPTSGGGSYTDAQARVAQLNRVAAAGTTTVTLGPESATDYGTATGGTTFTVDATGCVVGKVVRFALGVGATAPVFASASIAQPYKYLGVPYAAGKAFSYSLLVCVDRIEVIILAE